MRFVLKYQISVLNDGIIKKGCHRRYLPFLVIRKIKDYMLPKDLFSKKFRSFKIISMIISTLERKDNYYRL